MASTAFEKLGLIPASAGIACSSEPAILAMKSLRYGTAVIAT